MRLAPVWPQPIACFGAAGPSLPTAATMMWPRDHLPHQLPEDHIVRADQADVDHRDLIRVQPAQGRRDRIDGTAGRFAAADISGVELCVWRCALEPPGIADQPRCPHKYYRNQTPHSARARAVPAARAALTCRRCARYIDTAAVHRYCYRRLRTAARARARSSPRRCARVPRR